MKIANSKNYYEMMSVTYKRFFKNPNMREKFDKKNLTNYSQFLQKLCINLQIFINFQHFHTDSNMEKVSSFKKNNNFTDISNISCNSARWLKLIKKV